jgi:hypothetical protein
LCSPGPDAGPTVVYVVSDAGVRCNGACVPVSDNSLGWSPEPFVFWKGAATSVPKSKCPQSAPHPSQPWYSNPDQTPMSCPACSCAPSTGVCLPPASVTVSASPVCPNDGDAGVPFDPPSEWDGGCTTNDAIAAVDCDGGPCSVTVAPLVPVDECKPNQVMIPTIVTWQDIAFSCNGDTNHGSCANDGETCVPAAPSSVGYTVCVSQKGDDQTIMCPDKYIRSGVFYLGADDTRACAPCECGTPQGSTCSSFVSLYADDACSVGVASVTATSSDSMCATIPDGAELGSKRASPPTYTAGTCEPSGGAPTGFVKPREPFTLCCVN